MAKWHNFLCKRKFLRTFVPILWYYVKMNNITERNEL